MSTDVFVTWEKKTRKGPEEPVVVVEVDMVRIRMSPLAALNLKHELDRLLARKDIQSALQTEMREGEVEAGGRGR